MAEKIKKATTKIKKKNTNIKNITKDDERDWKRKVREITRAINVEKKLSKSQILELYLNLIYMGGQNIHGIALRK